MLEASAVWKVSPVAVPGELPVLGVQSVVQPHVAEQVTARGPGSGVAMQGCGPVSQHARAPRHSHTHPAQYMGSQPAAFPHCPGSLAPKGHQR